MTTKDPAGIDLINAIMTRADELSMTQQQVADHLGMAQAYLGALSSGARPVKGLGYDRLRQIAQFLNLPMVEVLLLAEVITPEDSFTFH